MFSRVAVRALRRSAQRKPVNCLATRASTGISGLTGRSQWSRNYSQQNSYRGSYTQWGWAAALGVASAAMLLGQDSEDAFAAGMPPEGHPGTNAERTFIAIKPDGTQRGLIGDIIKRFEQKGYKLVAIKMTRPTIKKAQGHYADLRKKPFFNSLVKYFSSGPIVAMVWEGKDAIKGGRRLLGETDPAKSPTGSIRGDFCIQIGRNIIHGSDGPDSAKHEINYWFTPEEITDWTTANDSWVYE